MLIRKNTGKGFSITRVNGKAVRETNRVKKGDVLETELFKGVIRSEIKDIEDKHLIYNRLWKKN